MFKNLVPTYDIITMVIIAMIWFAAVFSVVLIRIFKQGSDAERNKSLPFDGHTDTEEVTS